MPEEEEAGSLPDHLRCKRTDGRQWRCNRRVMEDKKLCEVHHLQGRHRQHRQKVPESLKLQRKGKKIFKVQRNPLVRAQKFRKMKKKKRVIGESEALDEAVKKMKLKRGDLQLELIRMVLKKEVEKRKKRKEFEDGDGENSDNSDSDSDTEFTRVLPNGLMAVSTIYSSANSDNAGSSCAVKIGAEPTTVSRRCFRSKNIEPVPVGPLQVVPYKRDVVGLRRRKCHWCRRRNSSLIKCSSCRKLFFCLDCVKERYFDTQEEVKKACPVCRGTCGCKACSSSQCRDLDYKDLLRGKTEVDKVLHFHYFICMLLPILKQINQDQSIELEIEEKMKGLTMKVPANKLPDSSCSQGINTLWVFSDVFSHVTGQKPTEVQIQEAELNCNRQFCCNNCQTSITDLHRRCKNCSYTLCLSCSRDILQENVSGSIRSFICKCPNIKKACTSGVQLLEKKSVTAYKQRYGSKNFDSSASSLNWKFPEGGVGISCPPMEFGGCGDSLLNLRCVFPSSWIKELEISAEQIVGCYELPETIDMSSCCSLCSEIDDEANGIRQLQKAAKRENSHDNFLYYPTVMDIQGDKIEHFQKHWGKGHPVVVRNVLQGTSELSWDPIVLFCSYLKNSGPKPGDDEGAANDANCLDWFEVEIGISQLFLGSVRGQKRANMCDEKLKLKGWLSSRLFQEQFPDHYTKIIKGLPFPEYMDPESGVLNIASKLLQKLPKPDLGPCVYISYGSGEELVQADSVTKLCYDLCDVVNILAHTTDDPVSTKQLNKIRELMKGHKSEDQMDSAYVGPDQKSSLNGEDMEVGHCDLTGDDLTRHETSDLYRKDKNISEDGEDDTDSDSSIPCRGTIRSSKASEKTKISDSKYFTEERMAETCGARWDVFRRQDVPKLIEYLRKHSNEFTHRNGLHKHVVHPILDQNFFLDTTHKMRLKEEFEIEPWTFEQHVGEAVIIPAGCPYQIKNLKSCVNVVLDFVSPESVSDCIQLIDELRLLPYGHKAKINKLEVKKMALCGISTAIKEIRELTCAE